MKKLSLSRMFMYAVVLTLGYELSDLAFRIVSFFVIDPIIRHLVRR